MGWMSHGLAFALVAVLFCCFVSFAQAQSTNATTDPSEGKCFLFSFLEQVFSFEEVHAKWFSCWEIQ